MLTDQKKVVIGVLVVLLALGSVCFGVTRLVGSGGGNAAPPLLALPAAVQTAAWYESHLPALKRDEARCASSGDVTFSTSATCVNVEKADQDISDDNFQKALSASVKKND